MTSLHAILSGLRSTAIVATIVASTAGGAADPPQGPTSSTRSHPASGEAAAPIERITTIGASATAGFGAYFWRFDGDRRVRDATDLAEVIRAAASDQVVVSSMGTGSFFLNPEGIGTLVVDRTLARRPDLVVAIDYLFWFIYGTIGPDARPMRTHEQRLEMLEHGLKQLDRLVAAGVPIVVGDIPDMSRAGGVILARSQVPPESTRTAANERIRAWIADRPEVRFLSLDRLQRMLQGEGPIEVAGGEVPASERRHLLQDDRLHPTVGGLVVMTTELLSMLAADQSLAARMPPIETDYATLVERITGLPAMRLQDPLERAFQSETDAALDRARSTPAPGADSAD